MKVVASAVLMFLVFVSCTEDRYYEDNKDFSERKWSIEDTVKFSFEIDSLEVPYRISLNIRNTIDYSYRNLYLKYELKQSMNLLEDQLIQLDLFEAKTGKPYGQAQSGIYSHQLLLQDSVLFPKKGEYTIHLRQYMREQELEGIVSSGIRIEQIK